MPSDNVFSVDIHLYIHTVESATDRRLDEILKLLKSITEQEKTIMADLTALTAQVKANTDTEASAIVLLNGLAAQIASLKNDPVALQALSDQLKTSGDALAAAIVANTPAA